MKKLSLYLLVERWRRNKMEGGNEPDHAHSCPAGEYKRLRSHPRDELQRFRASLVWLGLDQSSTANLIYSWLLFVLLTIVVPVLAVLAVSCDKCDPKHQRPYKNVVQISESVVASISFLCLSRLVRRHGLRRFLFLDRLCHESNRVRIAYTAELDSAFRLLAWFLLPCFGVELADKTWWYAYATPDVPLMGQRYAGSALVCFAELVSWLYRTAVFFLACVLFRLMCHFQILRFQDFIGGFQREGDGWLGELAVKSIVKGHMRIRHQLRVISHRFRAFIVGALVAVTFSQFLTLLITTRPNADLNFFKAGDLALCSAVLLTGVAIFLHSAARITHTAQSVASVASRWHALATSASYDSSSDSEFPERNRPKDRISASSRDEENGSPFCSTDSESNAESAGVEGENGIVVPSQFLTASYEQRQALVKYFEHNDAGITVFGFVLDRTSLQMIFGIELSLVLWILGKTIGIERLMI